MHDRTHAHWHNEPPHFEQRGDVLTVRTGKDTDFWNRTFYGFTHDNGHFLKHAVEGDFTAEVAFTAIYKSLYDQAGIMLRVDAANWMKAGIEFTDGVMQFSVVLTRDNQSDWSVMRLPDGARDPVHLRLSRFDDALRVDIGMSDGTWRMARLGFMAMPATIEVGPMCCSPLSEGLEVIFSQFSIGAPISRELHD
jgi:uncharacterized protein